MRRRIWTAPPRLACVAALVAVPSAYAAYTTAKLEVLPGRRPGPRSRRRSVPTTTRPRACRSTRRPATTLTTTQAPGTTLWAGAGGREGARPRRAPTSRSRGNVVVAAPGRSRGVAGGVHRVGDADGELAVGAPGGRADAHLPAVPDRDAGAQAALGPALIQVCLAAARRSRRDARPGDVRREALQRRAHDQRRLQPVVLRALGRVLDAVPRRASVR